MCAPREAALASLETLAADDGVHDLFTGREAAVSELRAHMLGSTQGVGDAPNVVLARLR